MFVGEPMYDFLQEYAHFNETKNIQIVRYIKND